MKTYSFTAVDGQIWYMLRDRGISEREIEDVFQSLSEKDRMHGSTFVADILNSSSKAVHPCLVMAVKNEALAIAGIQDDKPISETTLLLTQCHNARGLSNVSLIVRGLPSSLLYR